MKQKKKMYRATALMSAAGLALSLFFSPATGLPAQAAGSGQESIQPRQDVIEYRFTIMDGKLYKRLFNYSTSVWIGDWIYVCEAPEGYPPGKGESDGSGKHEKP